MKKIICLLAALCCLLMLIGCDKVPGEETLPPDTQPTQTTTAPTETTTPPETTVPVETTAPLVTEDIPYLLIQDQIHEVDPETEGTVIHTPDLDASGLVSATHIRFFTELSTVGTYKDGVFRVCTDEWEGNSGSHYQGYVVKDGQLKALENRTFAKEISFLGGKTYLEFQYAVNGDRVIITYEPRLYDDNGNPNYSRVVDTSRGLDECLVYLTYFTETDGKLSLTQYFDFLNLETGELMGLFTGFNLTIFQNSNTWYFVAWTEDGNPVFSEGDTYALFDMSTKTLVEDYSYEPREYALTYEHLYVDGKSYLEVTDPLDGETVLLKTPEYWNFKEKGWRSSADGRKLMATRGDPDILIYDGDRNMWIEISRELPNGEKEDICFWTENNEIVLVSKDRRYACIYSLAGE